VDILGSIGEIAVDMSAALSAGQFSVSKSTLD